MCTCLSQDPRSPLLDELRAELKAANERASEAEAAAEALRKEATEDAAARLHAEQMERLGVEKATELTDRIRNGRTMCTFVYAKSMYNSSVQFMNV